MSDKPQILVILGATGKQGQSVLNAITSDPIISKKYIIRAITRDPSSPKAKALERDRVELVKADMGDLESLKRAVEGADAVFGVTNYWESRDFDIEVKQGKNLADAVKVSLTLTQGDDIGHCGDGGDKSDSDIISET